LRLHHSVLALLLQIRNQKLLDLHSEAHRPARSAILCDYSPDHRDAVCGARDPAERRALQHQLGPGAVAPGISKRVCWLSVAERGVLDARRRVSVLSPHWIDLSIAVQSQPVNPNRADSGFDSVEPFAAAPVVRFWPPLPIPDGNCRLSISRGLDRQ